MSPSVEPKFYLLIFATIMSFYIEYSYSECCWPTYYYRNGCPLCYYNRCCADCTIQPLWCGRGQCNIIGCNCDGGCRRYNGPSVYPPPKHVERADIEFNSTSSSVDDYQYMGEESDVFAHLDLNKDGTLDYDEAEHVPYMNRNLFRDIDTNQDNRINFEEFSAPYNLKNI